MTDGKSTSSHVSSTVVDVSGLDIPTLLAALWKHSKDLGGSKLPLLTSELKQEAQKAEEGGYVDGLCGRPLKFHINEHQQWACAAYDRDSDRSGAQIVADLRQEQELVQKGRREQIKFMEKRYEELKHEKARRMMLEQLSQTVVRGCDHDGTCPMFYSTFMEAIQSEKNKDQKGFLIVYATDMTIVLDGPKGITFIPASNILEDSKGEGKALDTMATLCATDPTSIWIVLNWRLPWHGRVPDDPTTVLVCLTTSKKTALRNDIPADMIVRACSKCHRTQMVDGDIHDLLGPTAYHGKSQHEINELTKTINETAVQKWDSDQDAKDTKAFRACTGCHDALYCSLVCQVNHWATHKKTCPGKPNKAPAKKPKKSDAVAGTKA